MTNNLDFGIWRNKAATLSLYFSDDCLKRTPGCQLFYQCRRSPTWSDPRSSSPTSPSWPRNRRRSMMTCQRAELVWKTGWVRIFFIEGTYTLYYFFHTQSRNLFPKGRFLTSYGSFPAFRTLVCLFRKTKKYQKSIWLGFKLQHKTESNSKTLFF